MLIRADQIYADIYRPADLGGKKIPVIVAYSPYGKGGGGANLMDVVPYRVGVPKSRQSGLEKFEGFVTRVGTMRGHAAEESVAPIRTSGADEAMPSSILTPEDHSTVKGSCITWAEKKVSQLHTVRLRWNTGLTKSRTGQDCHDMIEHVAQYEWCNGNVGMAGNSWLGITQYWAAMEQPPLLKCIAPWEGLSDVYRDLSRRGGIPWAPFLKWVLLGVPGR
jgi:uncharacterized protein